MLHLVLGIFLLLTASRADDNPEDHVYYRVIKGMFEKRCTVNASPQVTDNMLNFTKLLPNCIPREDLVPLEGESGHDRLNFICSPFRAHAEGCLRKLGTKIKACLHPEEAYLHDFMLLTVNDTFVRLCSEESRAQRKDLDTTTVKDCMDVQPELFASCVKQSGLIDAFTEPEPVVDQYELCTIIFKITECAQKGTHKQCKDTKVAKYIADRYTSLTGRCDCHKKEHEHHHHHAH